MTTTPLGSAVPVATTAAETGLTSSHLRSRAGALGALVLLLALPLTIAVDLVFPGRTEIVIHLLLAIGTLAIGLSVFDFATPTWLTWTALVAACVLAAIFSTQCLAGVTQSETLRNVAYSPEMGGWLEALSASIVMAWFIAVARAHFAGVTMLLGIVSSAAIIGLSAWGLLAAPTGGTPAGLRLLFLVPIAWFLFASTRQTRA